MNSNSVQKKKIADSWQIGWKPKACNSSVLYLKVFKNDLYLFLNTQLQKNNTSYWKVKTIMVISLRVGAFEQFFGPGREGSVNKHFLKIQTPGGLPGGGGGDVEASIWLVWLHG